MKIKKVEDKPMVIHTKQKTEIHTHEPKNAAIKGSNIYTVNRSPKIKEVTLSRESGKAQNGISEFRKQKGEYTMSVLKITKDNFEKEVLKSDKPILLDFWASWCGPCRMVGPIVEQIAEETADTARVGKINVDEEQELAQAFQVMSIPTLVVMKDGKVVKSTVGVQSKQALLSMLQ